MTSEHPPVGAGAADEETLLGGKIPSLSSAPSPKTQAKNRAPCPIVLAARCRLTADLLAECVEHALGFGLAVLSAARTGNDGEILANFRRLDAAHRCARRCAEDLRGLMEARG